MMFWICGGVHSNNLHTSFKYFSVHIPRGLWDFESAVLIHNCTTRFCHNWCFANYLLPLYNYHSGIPCQASASPYLFEFLLGPSICQSKKEFYSRFCQTPLLQSELYASTSLWWTVEGPLKLVELPIVTSFFFFFQILLHSSKFTY